MPRRHGAAQETGRVVGTRLSFRRRQPDRRAGRVFHDQPAGCASLAASLSGHHQRHRESHAGVRMRTRRVCRWRDSGMVKRWMASALLATEKNFRKIMGYRDLWTLDAILNGSKSVTRREVA